MAPLGNPTPKKQSSLTSFFKPKTVNGLAATFEEAQAQQSQTEIPDGSENSRKDNSRKRPLEEDTDNGNIGLAKPKKKPRPSVAELVDELVDDDSDSNDAEKRDVPSVRDPGDNPETSRTGRYLYDDSQTGPVPVHDEDAIAQKKKEELHKKFVKKLGHPDSMSRIRGQAPDVDGDAADDAEEDPDADEEAEPVAPVKRTKKKGYKTNKVTPMESQFLDIKRKYMDTVLIVEVGYKFRFFGEDARTASKVLGIVCIPGKYRFDEREYIGFIIHGNYLSGC